MYGGAPTSHPPECYIRCHLIKFDYTNLKGGSYSAEIFYDGQSTPTSSVRNVSLNRDGTYQFSGQYAGDHAPGNYYRMRILLTGPETVDSGFKTYVNE